MIKAESGKKAQSRARASLRKDKGKRIRDNFKGFWRFGLGFGISDDADEYPLQLPCFFL
jgi:hypothetical protein